MVWFIVMLGAFLCLVILAILLIRVSFRYNCLRPRQKGFYTCLPLSILSEVDFEGRFIMPTYLLDNIDTWVHEATELTINEIAPFLRQRKILVMFRGVSTKMPLAHLMTCLSCYSSVTGEDLLSPEEFSLSINWIKGKNPRRSSAAN